MFLVDADGGSCESTLILNEKADISSLKDFVPLDMNIKFAYFIYYN
jgi:hypothetical protein